jgi:hypothetical protein
MSGSRWIRVGDLSTWPLTGNPDLSWCRATDPAMVSLLQF